MDLMCGYGQRIELVIPGRCNVYLLRSGDKTMLIDTSTQSNKRKLFSRLRELGITRIDYLLLTHTHFDHVGNARSIVDVFGARTLVHRSEAQSLANGRSALPDGTNPLTGLIARIGNAFPGLFPFDSLRPDLLLDDSTDLAGLGFHGRIIHTPGHSAGSLSVIVDGGPSLVGDCAFGIFKNAAFPPFAVDVPQLLDSWSKLLESGCALFLPSHGKPIPADVLQNEYRKRR